MDILYRNVPDHVYQAIADMACKLSKEKKRKVSQSEAMTALIKKAIFVEEKNKNGTVLQ